MHCWFSQHYAVGISQSFTSEKRMLFDFFGTKSRFPRSRQFSKTRANTDFCDEISCFFKDTRWYFEPFLFGKVSKTAFLLGTNYYLAMLCLLLSEYEFHI